MPEMPEADQHSCSRVLLEDHSHVHCSHELLFPSFRLLQILLVPFIDRYFQAAVRSCNPARLAGNKCQGPRHCCRGFTKTTSWFRNALFGVMLSFAEAL